ncbi:MAG: hypothetical protein NXH84_07065 [Rhodobacteraceae bacterium]|nr:hypothetical protein [Paracoccaceae bacterium]
MKAIGYVTRTNAGVVTRESILEGSEVSSIWAGGGQEISLNLRQIDIGTYQRDGQNLLITLADGRVIVLEDYFGPDGAAASRLFISSDGYLNEVALVESADGSLYAQYGPTDLWGKWSPSDDLIFLDGSEIAGPATGQEDVSMLGAGLLGGSGLLGAAGAGAAGLGAAALIGGGGGGGSDVPVVTRIEPGVNEEGPIVIGGDDAGPDTTPVTITGQADPDSTVVVTIGDETVETTSDENGEWDVEFSGEDFPEDGDYEVIVTVTETDGTETVLDGPQVIIDTTPPATDVQQGTVDTGDVVNAEEYEAGFDITGTGEVDANISVTIDGTTHETTVGGDGTWSVTFHAGDVTAGERTTDVVVVSTDAYNNTTTITETLEIDTIPHVLTINETTIEGDGLVNADDASDGIQITGTSEPGAMVTVTVAGITREVETGANGTWTATYQAGDLPAVQSDVTITASTVDEAGNPSTATGTIDIDTLVEGLDITSSWGGADAVINAAEAGEGLTVSGVSEPGTISVSVQFGSETVNANVNADGSWSATFLPGQMPSGTGPIQLTATATDAALNTNTVTRFVDIDTEAGLLTLDADAIGGDGVVNSDEADQGVMVTGRADPFAEVTVTFDGVEHTAFANGAGVWQTLYQSSEITRGDYDPDVTASVTDAAGNSRSVEATISVDTQVDNLNLDALNIAIGSDGNRVINGENAQNGFSVTGTIEQGAQEVIVTINGVPRAAQIFGDGTWRADFQPGDITAGQYPADLRVDVMDGVGNRDFLSTTVDVDTFVDELNLSSTPIEGDNIVNAAEARDGVTLRGKVEAGSSVAVTVFGTDYDADVDGSGNWSLNIAGADIPQIDDTVPVVITATDAALNVSSITESLTIDAIAPGSPDIVGYFREGGGYRNVTLETAQDDVSIQQVSTNGAVSELSLFEDVNTFLGETDYFFTDGAGNSTTIPDGSQLVVTSTDDAGNTSSTYLVLDETSTNTVDAGNPNLAQFDIETIDLRFGDQSQLTITEAQITALSENSDQVVVRGGTDDSVTITGAQAAGTTTLNGEDYNIYTLGDDATIVIDDDITDIVI